MRSRLNQRYTSITFDNICSFCAKRVTDYGLGLVLGLALVVE